MKTVGEILSKIGNLGLPTTLCQRLHASVLIYYAKI